MSLSRNPKLVEIAKSTCRELRKKATPAEKVFWELVRNRRFMNKKFYRQYPIFFDLYGKESFYVADFYCHELKLVVEIDGGYHERQKEYDQLRTFVINYKGIEVLRFKNDLVINKQDDVLNKIVEYINNTKLKNEI